MNMGGKPFLCLVFVVVAALLCSGCTETQKGTGVGALVGGGAGAAIGMAFGVPGLGAAIGAGGGALGGALIGDHLGRKKEKKQKAELQQQLQQKDQELAYAQGRASAEPAGGSQRYTRRRWVDTSRTESVWVSEHTVNGRVVPGHYEDRTVPSGNWEENQGQIQTPQRGGY